jgi:hypothetical protein
MMIRSSLATLAALALAACSTVDVRTATSPGANLTALHTFAVMPQPDRRSPMTEATNDPMLVNSITNRALRADLVKAFENRGYLLSETPDFTVAYYASAREKLDVTYWNYGYRYNPYWWGGGFYDRGYGPSVTEYDQGTVIVDVIDPATRELLWRGQGVARVSEDEAQYEQDLWKTVMAVLEKFPRATTRS